MATAPAEAETHIPGEQLPDNDGPVDFEAEARKLGWSPLEEFKGDPKHHLDAETFYNRSIEFMPIAKATIRKLTTRIDAMERDAKKSADFFSKAEERAYQRALDDIRAKQEAAVEAGDIDAHRAASAELDKLEKPGTPASNDDDPERRAEEFADWGRANKWYASNSVMQAYADSQAAIIAKRKGDMLSRDDLDAVSEKVRAKFPEEFEEEAPAPRQRRSPVDGGGQRPRSGGGRTYADLPMEARQMCDKWVRNGTIKSREDFVKSFDFDGYRKAAG